MENPKYKSAIRSGGRNTKQILIGKIQDSKQCSVVYRFWNLGFWYRLGFGIWDLTE